MNKGIWIIGDVHGEYDMLIGLIAKLPQDAKICFVGDLIDRGKKSAEVVNFIIENKYDCVLGNHEIMMIESLNDSYAKELWELSGGKQTLESYTKFEDDIFTLHIEYFKQLPYFLYYEMKNNKPLVVSHSYIHDVWVDKEHLYTQYDGKSILWQHMHNKKLFHPTKEVANNLFNIFGHSVLKKPYVKEYFAMIDTGATYKNKVGLGKLSAIHYPSLKIIDF
ncbi:metallophosphoesterase [Sulfurimonas sp. SAG-AH-194-I05]|nr:metallophosphoesterase [Sulfurimonas sp. SAG-AH-194-I05]MDF1876128.1 metallophosphoesterase [Sulfurimonas sp. SAG-AH-194-I05]